MSLSMQRQTQASALLPKIQALYEGAFPKAERIPFEKLISAPMGGYQFGLYAFMDGGKFCGFATTIEKSKLTLLGYFAIEADLRGQGYGSKALQLLRQAFSQDTIALEIETLNPAAANYPQRKARQLFYLKNGWRMSPIAYTLWGVDFVVMLCGPDVDDASYHRFYDPLVRHGQSEADIN